MAVRIRLRRMGKRNAPAHRIVVADARSPRDGRFIETIGYYEPRRKLEKIDLERVDYWLSVGAQPSKTVSAIIKRARAGVTIGDRAKAVPAAPADREEEAEITDELEEAAQAENAAEESDATDAGAEDEEDNES